VSALTALLAELENDGRRPAKTSEPRPVSRTKLPDFKAEIRPADLKYKQPSLRKRAARGLARVLIIFSMGVVSTLAFEGDAFRAMITSSYPQLGWFAPQAAAHAETHPDMVITPTATPSPDYSEQLKSGLAAVQGSMKQLAAQLVATQQWMAGDIAKLQAGQQDILDKISSPPPPSAAPAPLPSAAPKRPPAAALTSRPAVVPARKPAAAVR
jgi:hypothetical protein